MAHLHKEDVVGVDFEEIAQIMKSSLGTAKANYHHAVQKLKSMINVREEEDTAAGGAEERSIR